jgi:hypothetical protein
MMTLNRRNQQPNPGNHRVRPVMFDHMCAVIHDDEGGASGKFGGLTLMKSPEG